MSTMTSVKKKCGIQPKRLFLTPDTVPEFVIPGRTNRNLIQMDSSSPVHKRSTVYARGSPSESTLTADPQTSQVASSLRARLDSYRKLGQESSALLLTRPNLTDEHTSDSDPGYKLAMSINHLPKKTSAYGFKTLSENPQTTRKESLFFPRGPKAAGARLRSRNSKGLLCLDTSADMSSSLSPVQLQIQRRRSSRCMSNCVELSSGESEDDNPVTRERQNKWAKTSKLRRVAIRLPSQTEKHDQDEYDADYSSLENSPDLRTRRRSIKPTGKCETEETKRAFALQQLHLRCGQQLHSVNDLGGLEVALRYEETSKRLWVLLIRGENIGRGNGLSPKQVSSFVKLQIKSQKGTSATVKNTCDPFYNEEFVFENISRGDIKSSRLRLKVCRKRRGIPSTNVGEVWLDLVQLEQKGYVHCHLDLKPKHHFESKKQKELNIALSYRPSTRCLTVVIVKAQHVNSHKCVKGCHVEVELTQVSHDGSSLVTESAQTRPHHGFSASPVFKEAFSFHLNETQNIRDGLTLVVRIIRTKQCGTGGASVGQVRFGVGSTQRSEKEQWETLLRQLGFQTMKWHSFMSKP